MAITNLFSKRQKQLRKEVPDVYQYDEIPTRLRVQVVHILRDLFGYPEDYDFNGCLRTFQQISDILSREYGVFRLSPNVRDDVDKQVIDFLVSHANHEQVLDTIEVCF